MKVNEKLAQVAREKAADNANGYTNDYPDNWWWDDNDDMDCGSFISWIIHIVFLLIGIDTGHQYYEPMGSSIYNEEFLLKYFDKYDYSEVRNMVGDILMNWGHTEMVTHVDPDELTGARNDYDGVPGDYGTGREIATSSMFGNWLWLYRIKDKYNKEIVETYELPDIGPGDEGNTVLTFQYIMKYKLGYDKQKLSGKFDDQMSYNVRHYQEEHGLVPDKRIGKITRYSMITATGYEEP